MQLPVEDLKIASKLALKRLLGPLAKGRTIKREFWESSLDAVNEETVYQRAALLTNVAIEKIVVLDPIAQSSDDN